MKMMKEKKRWKLLRKNKYKKKKKKMKEKKRKEKDRIGIVQYKEEERFCEDS
jgi:hypothetical protein